MIEVAAIDSIAMVLQPSAGDFKAGSGAHRGREIPRRCLTRNLENNGDYGLVRPVGSEMIDTDRVTDE